jgi:hypothetical protein
MPDRCVRCGCDLRERPPRSYAEMEGLIGQPLTLDAPLASLNADPHEPFQTFRGRLIQRWLAFLFIAMIGLICLIGLSAQAFGS